MEDAVYKTGKFRRQGNFALDKIKGAIVEIHDVVSFFYGGAWIVERKG
ncbi:MAG: hypothetical protein PWR02_586 [Synergistales bacterium]|nr:hypothetical protein [Synergistales bacterium]